MNKIQLIGRLTKDGEIRTTSDDLKAYSNSLAVKRSYKNNEGNYETDFFNFTLWNNGLDKYLTKGKLIYLEGRLQNATYEKNGEKRHITNIIAEKIEILSSEKKQDNEQVEEVNEFSTMSTKTNYEDKDIHLSDSDLPF